MRLAQLIAALALGLMTAVPGVARANDAASRKVVETYANIAQAAYADSLTTAKTLQTTIRAENNVNLT